VRAKDLQEVQSSLDCDSIFVPADSAVPWAEQVSFHAFVGLFSCICRPLYMHFWAEEVSLHAFKQVPSVTWYEDIYAVYAMYIYISIYIYILIRLRICPHTSIACIGTGDGSDARERCNRGVCYVYIYMSSYDYVYVLILVLHALEQATAVTHERGATEVYAMYTYICPHTTTYMSSY
jgi:hypothetical protein